MSIPQLQQAAEEAMVALNAAITNMRLYPPASAIATQSIQRLHKTIDAVLAIQAPLELADSENVPLVCGTPLKAPIKPQTEAVFALLRVFGLKSLSFAKGLTLEHLHAFVAALCRKPAQIEQAGGLRRLLESQGVTTIRFNEKLYFAVAGQDHIDPAVLGKKIDQLLADPTFFDRISDDAIAQAARQGPQAALATLAKTIPALEDRLAAVPPSRQVSMLSPLLAALETADDETKSRMVAVLADANPQTLAALMAEGETIGTDAAWLDQLARAMDEDALETLGAGLLSRIARCQDPERGNRMETAYNRLCATEKGRELKAKIEARATADTLATENEVLDFKKALDLLAAGNAEVLTDPLFVEKLPTTINLLFIKEKERTAGQLLGRIEAVLASGQAGEAQAAARCLGAVGDFLLLDERHDTIAARLDPMVKALTATARPGSWAEPVVVFFHNAGQRLRALGRVSDAEPAERFFRDIAEGRIVADPDLVHLVCRLGECLPAPPTPPADGSAGQAAPERPPADQEALAAHLAEADRLIRRQETEKAVAFLFDRIRDAAERKQIDAAETLRDKLFEADPMALSQIVTSGEMIETARLAAMDPDHRQRWQTLYQGLSAEEAGAFFFALETISCTADQVLFQQGGDNTGLYFIESGQLKLMFRQGVRETLLALLKAGDVAGNDSFFTVSVNTSSLQTLSPALVRRLTKTRLAAIQQQHAGLESKLNDYCNKRPLVADLLKQKGMDRRAFTRYFIGGNTLVQLADPAGRPLGKPFKGSLADISNGGLSFFIKTSHEDAVRRLLGRQVTLRLALTGLSAPIEPSGMIVGAVYHMENDYSVHVKFASPVDMDLAGLGLKEVGV